MSRIAYVNGRYVQQAEASVHIEDRGYQLADGIYEVVYVNGGRLIDEALHLDRMERSLREIRVRVPMDRGALQHVLRQVLRRNRVRDGLLYMQVTRGVAPREHAFPAAPIAPSIVVTVRRLPAFPRDAAANAGSAITYPDERWARCDIKSTALLPNVLARQAAKERGAVEAILIDRDGMVTEGAATSVWAVAAGDVLRTRALGPTILPGCTRAALIGLMRDAGIAFEERAVSEAELREANEVFLTSASSFVKPVTRVDGTTIGDGTVGPVTRKLFDLFARHANGSLRNAA
ncbi:MAG: D-amino-acid transaminase [Acetobacteraceae bacterium]|nr:D-amino-acid transaminase [Acetobacteraceae bacterium]